MTWTIKLNVSNPAVLNGVNQAAVDVTFLATNTDGRSKSKTISRQNWAVLDAQYQAKEYLNELLAIDAAAATSNTTLPTINAYIATNPTLASG